MALGNGTATATVTNGTAEKTPVANGNADTLPRTTRQADPNTSFLRAARAGQLDKIVEFIDSGTIRDINTSNANGLNALHLAAKEGHIDVVKELVKRSAIVDAATKKGNTALHIASLAGKENVVRHLVQNGAAINVQSQNGFTPLYMAAQENHDEVVKFLLAKGANQTLATEDGFTPLAVAMQQGHDKVVTVLLEHDTRGKVRLPALHIAAKKDDVKAAALLLQNEHNPDITSKSGFTPLHIAAHYGNAQVAQLLHERGADVNYAAKHNITPLHVASKWGKVNMVTLLMEKGAHIEAKTRDGLTPLHCAARSGHDQVCDMLLEKGAPIHAKTKNGLAPLHMAAQGDHVEAARVLLGRGAPVDDVTVDYLTALHVASHCGHVRVAKLLLERKADPNSRALNGFTPLHIACKKNRIKVVELLLKFGASISATTESGLTPLHVASFMGCMNIVMFLLQNDANPDIPTVRGETPLHLAARANQTDIIRILLRNNASVDARAREQQTPLHVASRLGNTDIVTLLLQHGAQPDAATSDLYTPLHIAAKEGQEEVATVLLDNNASITTATKKGFTPLHLASKYGHLNVARLIILRSILLQQNNNDRDKLKNGEDGDKDVDTVDDKCENGEVEKVISKNETTPEMLLKKYAPFEIVDAPARNGVTPLHVAAHYDKQPVALLLLESGAAPQASARNGHTPLHIAAKKNQIDIAGTLLEHGASANAESKAGFTPLHLSVQEGHVDMTQLLLENNAEVNHKAKNGLTPLHLASQYDRQDIARILLTKSGDVNASTKSGYAPLHVASHYGHANMVKLLLENGARIDPSTELGYTPLHQAAQQGHTLIINILLKNKADPNAITQNGQTALSIANKLGYVTVVETLKVVTTETTITSTITSTFEEKYRVVAPEAMHDTFMSDSEDEGGEDPSMNDQQQYKYMTVDDMKSLGDDSMRLDVTNDERFESKHVNGDVLAQPHQSHLNATLDNVDLAKRHPIHAGVLNDLEESLLRLGPQTKGPGLTRERFLVSFLVDARGGAMRGCRHSGIRVIVPPRAACSPTRVTCRYVRTQRRTTGPLSTSINAPPSLPLCEGEALASRILELGPVAAKFLGPVILEVPHFASLRGIEREIIIMRSDTGESWREHSLDASNEAVQDVLQDTFEGDELSQLEDLPTSRIVRILTTELPRYIAVIQRGRQDSGIVGPEGGTLSCRTVPQAQAIFPPNSLTKRIKVALQAQPIEPALVVRTLGRGGIAVSPVLTVEPRRRKFHKAITLALPAPKAHSHGMINQYQSGQMPTLRLLCSITGTKSSKVKTGGQNPAVWEDVTGSTPLTFVKDCVQFTTTVSARFWLMDCRNAAEATRYATELYKEASHAPYMAKFVVFAKRTEPDEALVRVFCITDDKEDKTLETQENFSEVAKSRDVEVLDGKIIYLECGGNLVPITKSGQQLTVTFNAFQENRLAFTMRVKDTDDDLIGRLMFMSEPKVAKGEVAQAPLCTLKITLPDVFVRTSSRLHDSSQYLNGYLENDANVHRAEISLATMSRLLDADWWRLATELTPPLSAVDVDIIKAEYFGDVPKQASVMLKLWLKQAGADATGNNLGSALHKIGRSDIVDRCIGPLEPVTDSAELILAHSRLDQSALDALRDELTSSRDSTLERNVKNKILQTKGLNETLDRSGFDALREELGPSRNITVIEEDVCVNENVLTKTESERKGIDDDNKNENVQEEKILKSILKKDTSIKPGSKNANRENDLIEKVSNESLTDEPITSDHLIDKEAIALLTQQLDKLPGKKHDKHDGVDERVATPPPSPFYTYGENAMPVVEEPFVKVVAERRWTEESLEISEEPLVVDHHTHSSSQLTDDSKPAELSINNLEIIEITKTLDSLEHTLNIDEKTRPLVDEKIDIDVELDMNDSSVSKIPLPASKTSTPIKVKTIKKHTKIAKELLPNQPVNVQVTRPTVEDIDWDLSSSKNETRDELDNDGDKLDRNSVKNSDKSDLIKPNNKKSRSRKSKSKKIVVENSSSSDSAPTSPLKSMSDDIAVKLETNGNKNGDNSTNSSSSKNGKSDPGKKSKLKSPNKINKSKNEPLPSNALIQSEVTHSNEIITRSPLQQQRVIVKTTLTHQAEPEPEVLTNIETLQRADVVKNVDDIVKSIARDSTQTVTHKQVEVGPRGEKITRLVKEYPDVSREITVCTEIGPDGKTVVRQVGGDAEIHPELLKRLIDNGGEMLTSQTTTRTVTEIGSNGEEIKRTITTTCDDNVEHEITLKTHEMQPSVTRTVTELKDHYPTMNVRVSPKSKIPVLISDNISRKNHGELSNTDESDDEEELRDKDGDKAFGGAGAHVGNARVVGSSSGSDVALHEGLSEDETDDVYQTDPVYSENVIEEEDPVTGAKVTRTVRTVTQALNAPGNRDMAQLQDSMQHVLEQFMADERKGH